MLVSRSQGTGNEAAPPSPLICIWNEQPRRSRFVAPVIYLYCHDRVTLLNKLQLVPVVFLSDVERNFRFPNSRSDFFLRLEIKFMNIFNNIGSFEGKGRKDNLFFFFEKIYLKNGMIKLFLLINVVSIIIFFSMLRFRKNSKREFQFKLNEMVLKRNILRTCRKSFKIRISSNSYITSNI